MFQRLKNIWNAISINIKKFIVWIDTKLFLQSPKNRRKVIYIFAYVLFITASLLLLQGATKGLSNVLGEEISSDLLWATILLFVVGMIGLGGLFGSLLLIYKGYSFLETKDDDKDEIVKMKKKRRIDIYGVAVFIALILFGKIGLLYSFVFIGLCILIGIYGNIEGVEPIKKPLKKVSPEKEKEFIYRANILKLIRQSMDLSDEGDLEQSNDLLDRLSKHKVLKPYIHQYLPEIYANMGWNHWEMDEISLAFMLFKKSLLYEADNKVALSGIDTIRHHYLSQVARKDESKFELLRGFPEMVKGDKDVIKVSKKDKTVHKKQSKQKTPYEYIDMLGFERFDDFFAWLLFCFVHDKEKFGCGPCCRGLLPKLVREGQKLTRSDMAFNEIVALFWDTLSDEEKKILQEQYFHYFYELKIGARVSMYNYFIKNIVNEAKEFSDSREVGK